MSADDNKAAYRRFVDEINKGNIEGLDEFFSPDYVEHSAPPGAPPGIEAIKGVFTMFRTAFPDVRFTIEDVVAELRAEYGRTEAVAGDLSTEAGADAVVRDALATGRVDILVNNAGPAPDLSGFWETPGDAWTALYNNVVGTAVRMIHRFVPA